MAGTLQRMPDGRIALTIAGFDPSSGAGITADLAVFSAHGIFGVAAITALTVQSTVGVRSLDLVNAKLLTETLACLSDDLPPLGVKIGMLGGPEQVVSVAEHLIELRRRTPHLLVVLDPVIRSSSGAELLSAEGRQTLQRELLPLVDVVTPNTEELSLLTGGDCHTDRSIEVAARQLAAQHPGLAVLTTGGHRDVPNDLLLQEGRLTVLLGQRIDTRATHGTGCALSSALLCHLMRGMTPLDAARHAKTYVAEAMRSATIRGQGNGPLNLLWPIAGQGPS